MDNKSNTIPYAKFSIYKLDLDMIPSKFNLRGINKNNNYESVLCNRIIKEIKGRAKSKKCIYIEEIKYQDFKGLIFKTEHDPAWKDMLQFILINNEDGHSKCNDYNEMITNTNISYVLLYVYKKSIYAMTGGYGSYYISSFIVKNYGLSLIPKIITKENPVIKKIVENNLIGNRLASQRANRTNTSILTEQDLSSIYKELYIQADKDISKKLGIKLSKEEQKKNKSLNIVNKDSLAIQRSFSIKELKSIISKLNHIECNDDSFALNYFVLVKKKNIKEADLTKILIDEFKNLDMKKFTIVGNDPESYYFNADSYQLNKIDDTIFIKKNEPIELRDIFEKLGKEGMRLTTALISEIVKKWTITTIDNSGNILLNPIPLYDVLQGFVEYGPNKLPCYLINGSWYVFDTSYESILEDNYRQLFNLKLKAANDIKLKYKLKINAKNEDLYNKKFKNKNDIIYANTALIDNVEIADLIFWDDNMVYLMHNKAKFDGNGTRDLVNQILTASEYLQKNLSIESGTFLRKYYKKLCSNNKVDILPSVTEDKFIEIFQKKICFIGGFLTGYKKETKSTYAKYLTFELNIKLKSRGQEFIPMGILV